MNTAEKTITPFIEQTQTPVTPYQPDVVLTPMTMIEKALSGNVPPETLDKLLSLQERWEENQARKAFNQAFANFKAETIVVVRNRGVTDGPLKGRKYAELFSFVDAATPALSRNGLSASWVISRDEKDWIEVSCVIEHVLGGKKSVSLGGPPDTGGAKNALQARISTVTYLERATFKAACGLSEQGDDNDGNTRDKLIEGSNTITPDEFIFLRDLIETGKAVEAKVLASVNASSLETMTQKQYREAVSKLQAWIKSEAKNATAKQ